MVIVRDKRWTHTVYRQDGKCAAFDTNGKKLSGWYASPHNLIHHMNRKRVDKP